MSPEVPTILQLSLARLMGGITEHGAAFAQGQMGLIGMMMTLSAKEYERGADIRHTENEDMRKLFGELAGGVGDAALKTKLSDAAKSRDESLRISVLNANNYALRRLLTEAQIYAEDHGAAEAQKRIWAILKALAARRLVQLGP
ncbi:MAG: hypothetical protein ISS15_18810 [Alphaproteobacteria bacterium]|nr:hypothetical protein [Alphaproteobacteria bacterium]MBL7099714.1 hypothetical protein [Alphaproteobacteria bacterium]